MPRATRKDARAAEDPAVCARTLVERARRELETCEAERGRTLEKLRTAIATLAPRLGIRRAVLIGSLAWGDFDPRRSDVDLVVWGLPQGTAIDAACDIWDFVGRPVHVIRAETAPSSLLERAECDGVPIDVT